LIINFEVLHLQALSKSAMRQLVANYNATKHIGTEDTLLSGVAGHMESINIHRTPLNCYTILRVLDSSYNEKLLNKSKLLKAILFVLFDVEVIFFYPYAINFRDLGMEGFLAVLMFVAFFLCGFIYIIKKGAIEWEE